MRSKLIVVVVVVGIASAVVAGLVLRAGLRCAGFPGPGVTVDELPPETEAGATRFATWNVRNFPLDERPQYADLGYSRRTNICDLRDVLAGLDADLMALAEITDTRRFPLTLERSGGETRDWQIAFAPYGGRFGQKTAVAWDDRVFELRAEKVVLDGLMVRDGARPGVAARLGRRDGTLEMVVAAVHLESSPRAWPARRRQVEALAAAVGMLTARFEGVDLVVAGDFNTSGWEGGTPQQELERVDSLLAEVGLQRVANLTGCTSYWEGREGRDGAFEPSNVDHVYVRTASAEVSAATSWLHCRRLGCAELVSRSGAEDGTFFDVSDHCPVVVDLTPASSRSDQPERLADSDVVQSPQR